MEVSGGESGVPLDRTRNESSALAVFSDQLKCLQIIRSVSPQSSAPNSDSIDCESLGVAVEIFSQRRSHLVGLVSEEISLLFVEESLVIRIAATSLS